MRKIAEEVKGNLTLDVGDRNTNRSIGLTMALELMAEKLDAIEDCFNQPVPKID